MKQQFYNNNAFQVAFFTVLFFTISLIGVFNHVMWLDETWHYLIPRESASLLDIFSLGYNNGHPKLWNAVVFLVIKIYKDVLIVQLLHSFIATACAFLILKYAPFKLIDKVLIIFGYYFLFEYNIIAKHYILGITLIISSVVLFEKGKSIYWIALLLGLAANCHLFSLLVAAMLFLYYFHHRLILEKKSDLLVAALLFGGLILFSVWQIIPPEKDVQYLKSFENASLLSADRFHRVFSSITRGLINIPDFRSLGFWNTNLLYNISPYLVYAFAVLLVFALINVFKKDKRILALYFISMLLIMCVIFYFPLGSGIRYWGYYYIMLVVCLWLFLLKGKVSNFSKLFFRAIFALQFLISIPVYYITLTTPFSNSKNAAKDLTSMHYVNVPLFAENIGLGFPLSAQLNTTIYYPHIKEYTKYTANNFHKNYQPKEFIEESLTDLKSMKKDSCILVMNHEISDVIKTEFMDRCVIKSISQHTGAIVASEDYFLYLLKIKTP